MTQKTQMYPFIATGLQSLPFLIYQQDGRMLLLSNDKVTRDRSMSADVLHLSSCLFTEFSWRPLSELGKEAGYVAQCPESIVQGGYGRAHPIPCNTTQSTHIEQQRERVLCQLNYCFPGPCRYCVGGPGVGMGARSPPCSSPMVPPDRW